MENYQISSLCGFVRYALSKGNTVVKKSHWKCAKKQQIYSSENFSASLEREVSQML
jgi:hypothetical protein